MTNHQILALTVMSAVVLALRALPFAVFRNRKPSPLFLYLGKTISAAAIAMLVVYSLSTVSGAGALPSGTIGLFSASAVVVLLQIFFKNPLLSIAAGTVIYMLSVQGVLGKLLFF